METSQIPEGAADFIAPTSPAPETAPMAVPAAKEAVPASPAQIDPLEVTDQPTVANQAETTSVTVLSAEPPATVSEPTTDNQPTQNLDAASAPADAAQPPAQPDDSQVVEPAAAESAPAEAVSTEPATAEASPPPPAPEAEKSVETAAMKAQKALDELKKRYRITDLKAGTEVSADEPLTIELDYDDKTPPIKVEVRVQSIDEQGNFVVQSISGQSEVGIPTLGTVTTLDAKVSAKIRELNKAAVVRARNEVRAALNNPDYQALSDEEKATVETAAREQGFILAKDIEGLAATGDTDLGTKPYIDGDHPLDPKSEWAKFLTITTDSGTLDPNKLRDSLTAMGIPFSAIALDQKIAEIDRYVSGAEDAPSRHVQVDELALRHAKARKKALEASKAKVMEVAGTEDWSLPNMLRQIEGGDISPSAIEAILKFLTTEGGFKEYIDDETNKAEKKMKLKDSLKSKAFLGLGILGLIMVLAMQSSGQADSANGVSAH